MIAVNGCHWGGSSRFNTGTGIIWSIANNMNILSTAVRTRTASSKTTLGGPGTSTSRAGAACGASGCAISAAQAIGTEFANMGLVVNPTHQTRGPAAYKRAIVYCSSDDIPDSNLSTSLRGNEVAASALATAFELDNLQVSNLTAMNFGGDGNKACKDTWSRFQDIGTIDAVFSAADLAEKLKKQYATARVGSEINFQD
jgi:hypothetical protein